jgi:tetratricopeptide (TPR) repeat protein
VLKHRLGMALALVLITSGLLPLASSADAGVPVPASVESGQALIEAAEQKERTGDYAEAERLYKAAVAGAEAMPNDRARLADATYRLARLYYRQQRYPQAIPLAEKLIEMQTADSPRYIVMLGQCYFGNGNRGKAFELFNRAIEEDARDGETQAGRHERRALADALMNYRQYDQAERLLLQNLQSADRDKDTREADKTLESIVKLHAGQGRTALTLMTMKQLLERSEDQYGPASAAAVERRKQLAFAYAKAGKFEDGEKLLTSYVADLTKKSENSEALANALALEADFYEENKKFKQAAECERKEAALRKKGNLLLVVTVSKADRSGPSKTFEDQHHLDDWLASTYALRHQWKLAEQVYETRIARASKSKAGAPAAAQLGLARIYALQGRWSAAQSMLRNVLSSGTAGEKLTANANSALLLQAQNRFGDAERLYEQLLGDNSAPRYSLTDPLPGIPLEAGSVSRKDRTGFYDSVAYKLGPVVLGSPLTIPPDWRNDIAVTPVIEWSTDELADDAKTSALLRLALAETYRKEGNHTQSLLSYKQIDRTDLPVPALSLYFAGYKQSLRAQSQMAEAQKIDQLADSLHIPSASAWRERAVSFVGPRI